MNEALTNYLFWYFRGLQLPRGCPSMNWSGLLLFWFLSDFLISGGAHRKARINEVKNSLNLCIYMARKKVRNSATFLIDFLGTRSSTYWPYLEADSPKVSLGSSFAQSWFWPLRLLEAVLRGLELKFWLNSPPQKGPLQFWLADERRNEWSKLWTI